MEYIPSNGGLNSGGFAGMGRENVPANVYMQMVRAAVLSSSDNMTTEQFGH